MKVIKHVPTYPLSFLRSSTPWSVRGLAVGGPSPGAAPPTTLAALLEPAPWALYSLFPVFYYFAIMCKSHDSSNTFKTYIDLHSFSATCFFHGNLVISPIYLLLFEGGLAFHHAAPSQHFLAVPTLVEICVVSRLLLLKQCPSEHG